MAECSIIVMSRVDSATQTGGEPWKIRLHLGWQQGNLWPAEMDCDNLCISKTVEMLLHQHLILQQSVWCSCGRCKGGYIILLIIIDTTEGLLFVHPRLNFYLTLPCFRCISKYEIFHQERRELSWATRNSWFILGWLWHLRATNLSTAKSHWCILLHLLLTLLPKI